MGEVVSIDLLAAAIAGHLTPAIPLEIDLWSGTEIAAYLKVGARQVLERYAPLPDFPKAIRLPTSEGGKGQPRWKASEVIAWAERYQEGVGTSRGRSRQSESAIGNRAA